MSTDVELIRVRKSYGKTAALRECSLAIDKGEFVSFLGPSGCGKTTTLNIIAGFFEPTSGTVRIRGQDVTSIPPNRRNVGMVFQNYALFPHMTVAENIGFGLKMKKVDPAEIARRVRQALALVRMEAFAGRYPRQLSGGQQQRVALARAVAPQPSVLLLDEPLSNLDLKLRESMRRELKLLQRELGVTAIFVTHDQDEALTLSDRVVVMREGEVEQIGTPAEIYARPATRFVAGFVGQVNFLDAAVRAVEGDQALVQVAGIAEALRLPAAGQARPGQAITVGVRPENLRIAAPGTINGSPGLAGTLREIVPAGAVTQAYFATGGDAMLRADFMSGTALQGIEPGAEAVLAVRPEHIIPFWDNAAPA